MSQSITAPGVLMPSIRFDRRTRIVIITCAAFLVRLALIFGFHTYQFTPAPYHYSFGFEIGSIAASLASGHGFSSPFGVPSGPTTWIAPVYPALVAGFFKVFGLFSTTSAIGTLIFNSLCSALTVPFIYRIARRVFDDHSAEIASWIWAVVPFFSYWSVVWVWETALSALLCAIVFSVTLEFESRDWRAWAGLGVLWAVIALTSPALLAFLPASFLYPVWKLRSNFRSAVARLLIASLFFFIGISPWLARNQAVFHRPIFLRGNFWFEVSLSNFHNSTGEAWGGLHPTRNPNVLNKYVAMGEPAFFADAKQRVYTFIRTYPAEFARLTATRIVDFWNGDELRYEPANLPLRPWMILLTSAFAVAGFALAIVRKRDWVLFGWLLFLFPIPYYVTCTYPRYRHPIEPLMVVLTGYFFSECWTWFRERRRTLVTSVRGTSS
jgi:4-amino-4-deoxy-L-arabinose transferase-like glycosyltransferase